MHTKTSADIKMHRATEMPDWTDRSISSGATKLLVEVIDRMVYATNSDRSIIYGNWSLDAGFGWVYAIPFRWSTRYRKFKEV